MAAARKTSSKSLSRQQQKAATRQALLDAARQCFEELGYQGTGIKHITAACGVAHGTFYVHFDSKEALLAELLHDFNVALVARLVPIWADATVDALQGRIRRSAGAFLDHWAGNRGLVEAVAQRLGQGVQIQALQQTLAPEVAALLSAQLERLAAEAGSPLPHAESAVQALLAMWARLGLQFMFADHLDRDGAVDLLERLTRGALQGLLPAGIPGLDPQKD